MGAACSRKAMLALVSLASCDQPFIGFTLLCVRRYLTFFPTARETTCPLRDNRVYHVEDLPYSGTFYNAECGGA